MADADSGSDATREVTGRPGARMVIDVGVYLVARLLLAAVLAVVIFGGGAAPRHRGLPGRSSPCCSQSCWPFRWASGCSPRCGAARRRASPSSTSADARDREQLRARLRGDEPPDEVTRDASRRSVPNSSVPRAFSTRRPTGCRRRSWSTSCGLHRRVAGGHAWTSPSFDEPVRRGRAGYAALVGVPVESVAMGGSVSALLGLVAAAVPDGCRVATLAGEFTSTTFPFAAQAGRGVTLTELSADELVASAADYDVVVASVVQSANGDVLDVDALRAAVVGHRHADRARRHPGGRVEAAGSRLGRRHRRSGVQVDAGSARYGVDVVERQDVSTRDPACRELVRGDQNRGRRSTACRCDWPADARRFDTSPAWFGVLGSGLTLPWLAVAGRDGGGGALRRTGQPGVCRNRSTTT